LRFDPASAESGPEFCGFDGDLNDRYFPKADIRLDTWQRQGPATPESIVQEEFSALCGADRALSRSMV